MMARCFALALAAAVALGGVTAEAFAAGEHDRRLAAELLVMRGDARRLADPATPEVQARGLADRLAGALSSLPVLIRQTGAPDDGTAARLRQLLAEQGPAALAVEFDKLTRRFPLDLSRILPLDPTPARIARGGALHEEACAPCHDAGPAEVPLPAFPLAAQARSMPPEEFAARLINGVRGDATTALANPLGDGDMAALMAFYLFGE